jgi:cobalt/nickel transport system permease protein
MHIMEGFLPSPWWEIWWAIAIPPVVYGTWKMTRLSKAHPEAKPLLAIAGAFILVLSSLKLPSVTGSCSHPTGTGIAVVLFGPWIASVLSIIVLVFQATFLAHGGFTTMGANDFSMGIAGPMLGYLVWRACKVAGIRGSISMFLTAAVADLFTYVITGIQLAIVFQGTGGFMDSFLKFEAVYAITQIPLAIGEGILSVLMFDFLVKYRSDLLKQIKSIAAPTGTVAPVLRVETS